MMCLDENTLQAFVDGGLTTAERSAVENHFDECDECRRLVAALVAGAADDVDVTRAPTPEHGADALQPGDRVDQYRLLRLVGRGGMGRVWLARDTTLGRKVALKLLPDLACEEDAAVDRFLREARVTAQFNHPHIVTLYGVGELHETPYLALEYVEGQTLRERMDEERLGIREALRIGIAIGEAAREAHHHNVLHRDLKPQNVILATDGRLRVLDFGLAKPTGAPDATPPADDGAETSSGRTDPRLRFGTPAYMAPEQWRGEPATPATDVWGLGAMLHELFTGRRFYEPSPSGGRLSAKEIRALVCGPEPIPTAGRHENELAPDLVALVDACLCKAPGDRSDLEALLDGLRGVMRRQSLSPDSSTLPFRGLLPLTERHADLFFGRDTELGSFLEQLRQEPVLPVVGPSGAGKSSFVLAGVIPRLREHGRWLVLRMRPGRHPFETLAARLELGESGISGVEAPGGVSSRDPKAGAGGSEAHALSLEERLAKHPTRLTLELARLAESQRCRVLLFVDQLEELYTLVDDEETRRAFMRGLCTAADDVDGPVRVIFTLRDDFLWRLAEGAEAQAVLGRIVVLRPPGPDALTEFLERTTQAVGYRFVPPSLPREMVREVEGEAAALPLLQFAGQQIWERRDRRARVLDREAYEAVGGVAGALAQHADEALAAMPPQHEVVARQIFLRMVTPESTRRVVSRKSLLAGLDEDATEVLEQLTAARAIVVRRGVRGPPELELVHESLIHSWHRLAGWLDESREERVFLAEVGQAASLWDQRGQSEAEVWQGEALAQALRQAVRCTEVPALSERFLRAGSSRQARSARRRRLTLVVGVGLLALVTMGAVLFSLTLRKKEHEAQKQRREAQRQRHQAVHHEREALRQQTSALLESAQAALSRGALVEARAKVRQVLEATDSPVARALWRRLHHSALRWKQRLGSILYDVKFAPDGQTVAVASLDHAIHLFDVVTGRRRVLRGHADQVMAVAFAPDGLHLASATWGGDVWLWNLKTGKSRVLGRHAKGVNALDFDSRGARLASASSDRTVRIWDTRDRRILATLTGHSTSVRDVRFSPAGKRIATAALDGTIRVWDPRNGRELRRISAPGGAVQGLAYHPRGDRIATASADRAIRLWDARTGQLKGVWSAHRARVIDLAFGPRGRLLASAGADKTVRLWDTSSGRVLGVLRDHDAPARGVAFSPDGRLLASVSEDGFLRLWSVDKATAPPLTGHQGAIMGMSFHPRRGQLATGGVDRTVRLWDTATGRVVRVLRGHQAQVLGVSYSPDGARLASASYDRTVRIWAPATGRVVAVLRGHHGPTFDVSFSPDGKTLASSSYDRTVRLWNLATGRTRSVLRGHTAKIYDVRFSPDGRLLVTASADRTARLWEVRTGKQLGVLREHQNTVRGVSFSPNGRTLATGGVDRRVRLWDLTSRPVRLKRTLGPHPGRVYGAQFTPDGKGLGVPCSDGTAWLWDLASGRKRVLRGHQSEVNILRFDRRGRQVATASDDGTVRLWWTDSGRPVWRATVLLRARRRVLTHQGWIPLGRGAKPPPAPTRWRKAVERRAVQATESEDGRRLCLQTWAGVLELWDLPGDRRLHQRALAVPTRVIALSNGCFSLSGGVAERMSADGRIRVLKREATAIATSGDELLVAAGSRIYRFSPTGASRGSVAAAAGVTALARMGPWWVLGFSNGGIELRPTRKGPGTPRISFENTPASPVVRLVAGQNQTVVAGFASGHFGLWGVPGGAELARGLLHGPAVHLLRHRDGLRAVSGLGQVRRLDLRLLHLGYCRLLEQVWRSAPVIWRNGQPHRHPRPTSHPCLITQ